MLYRTKTCSKCFAEKPLSLENFRQRARKTCSAYWATVCRDCDRAYGRERYAKVPLEQHRAYSLEYERSEAGKAARARSVAKLTQSGWIAQDGRKRTLQRFGFTLDDFASIKNSQSNRCAVCREEFGVPYIDHDHATNRFRGLLCINCNAGLGVFYDDTRRLFVAASYLTQPLPLIDRSRSYPVKGQRDEQLRSNYNITLDGFTNLLHRQSDACAICKGASGKLAKCVDHIHGSTDIRGILCNPCNLGLGYFKDNPTVIASAIWYLHKSRQMEIAA